MSVAVCLTLVAGAVAFIAPRLLPRLTRSGVSPWFGIVAWLAAVATVFLSGAVAAGVTGFTLLSATGLDEGLDRLTLGACIAVLGDIATGSSGRTAQFGVAALALAALVAAVYAATRTTRAVVSAGRRTRMHAESARLIGRPIPDIGAVVVDAPQRAAYCIGGRRGTIVLTSAALSALDQQQLGAVVAHERAHLRQGHHLLLAGTRSLANGFPRILLFQVAAADLAVLLEMAADDAARREHGIVPVLGALLALAGPVPDGTLAASSVGVGGRAVRLATPVRGSQIARNRVALGAVTTTLTALPTLAVAGTAYGPVCGLFGMT